jgi:nicotinate-nucleotide adenylyltransferase
MRLGVMGGTFDPIHLGHLRAAETAREALLLDQVAFVPAHVPPHRSAASPVLDRFAMVCLATAGHPAFQASDLELRRDGPSYTADTLRALRAARPEDALVLIVGSDTYPEMATWREPEAIFAACEVAVVARPGDAAADGPTRTGVRRVAGPGLPISSSEVRRRVSAGHSIRYLVPEPVADYIAKRGLYR